MRKRGVVDTSVVVMVAVVVHDSKIARLLEGKWIVLRVNALIAASRIGHDNLRGVCSGAGGEAGTGLYSVCNIVYFSICMYLCTGAHD